MGEGFRGGSKMNDEVVVRIKEEGGMKRTIQTDLILALYKPKRYI